MANGVRVCFQPDFGQQRVVVQDAFIGYDPSNASIRIGCFRPAYGVERSQSSATLLHGERSLANSLMPSRNFGAQPSLQRSARTLTLGGFHTAIMSVHPPPTPTAISTPWTAPATTGCYVWPRVPAVGSSIGTPKSRSSLANRKGKLTPRDSPVCSS